MRMRLKEVKWTLWVKEELGACCRRRAQSERELGGQMRLLLTASTEHLMARDGGLQALSSTPLVSHFVAFSRGGLSAFVNMWSPRTYFTVINIVSRFLFSLSVFFLFSFSFQGKFFQFLFCFRVGEQASALMPWRLGWFFFGGGGGVYVFFMMWYTAREREHRMRTYQRQATFWAWYEDMRISGTFSRFLFLSMSMTLLLLLIGPPRFSRSPGTIWLPWKQKEKC